MILVDLLLIVCYCLFSLFRFVSFSLIWTVQLDHSRQCYQLVVRLKFQVQLADKFHISAEGCLVFGFAPFPLPVPKMKIVFFYINFQRPIAKFCNISLHIDNKLYENKNKKYIRKNILTSISFNCWFVVPWSRSSDAVSWISINEAFSTSKLDGNVSSRPNCLVKKNY